ncbi:MAG: DUF4214 domain-containing protein [bacterium]|nr:DUF4214 domain-containing protein [bacterium]
MNQRIKPSFLLAAVGAGSLVALVAFAQGKPGDQTQIDAVRIAVWDPETKEEILTLISGETLEIAAGDSVILRIFSPADKNPTQMRQYLSAGFSIEAGRERIALREVDVRKGSCVVEALAGRAADKSTAATLRYELKGKISAARKYQERGTVTFEIIEPEYELTKGEAFVWLLYRAILLREPDRERARPWIEQVERGGYRSLIEVAYQIAESRESQVHLYERGVSNQERLLAIYGHLLGLDADEVDLREWQHNLARLDRGEVTEVVMDIVDSYEFRQYHGIHRRRR